MEPPSEIVSLKPDRFPLGQNPAAADLLADWAWFQILPPARLSGWYDQIAWVREGIENAVNALSEDSDAASLCLFGPFCLDAVLGAVVRFAKSYPESRFCLPGVENPVRGPGYVETLFTVEWSPGCLDLLFSASDDAPSGLLPCNCRVSVVVSRERDSGVLSGKSFFDSAFSGNCLREESEAVLRTAKFLILPPLDFDDWILGAHRSEISRAEEFLRTLDDLRCGGGTSAQ